jgi:hypothetical protein
MILYNATLFQLNMLDNVARALLTAYALIYVRQLLSIQTSLSNEKDMSMTKKKNKEKFEDTKGVIRIHKSKGRQFNGHMKIESKTIIGPHSTTHKHIDWST